MSSVFRLLPVVATPCLLALAGCCATDAAKPALPPTPAVPLTEMLHGQAVADPYRWLEGPEAADKSPEAEALRARIRDWTDRQNALTRRWLDDSPVREAWRRQLQSLINIEMRGAPTVCGEWEFAKRRQPGKPQAMLFVRNRTTGLEKLLFDPAQLDASGHTTMDWHTPSQDGALVALGLFANGNEKTELRLLRTADGKLLDDRITGRVCAVSWMPDGRSFVYRRLLDEENPCSGAICYHVVGQPMSADRIVMRAATEGPLAKGGGPAGELSRDGRWLAIEYGLRQDQSDIWVADWQAWLTAGELRTTPILSGLKAGGNLLLRGDQAWLLTDDGAPNRRLFLVDLKKPERANWREIIPQDSGSVLENVQMSRSHLVVSWRRNGVSVLEKRDLEGGRPVVLPLPGQGSVEANVSEESDSFYLTYTSYLAPRSVYSLDMEAMKLEAVFAPKVAADLSRYEAVTVEVPSTGGVRVPLTIIRRKDVPRDGRAPAVVYGYGGFSVSQEPAFMSTMLPWLDAGGVLAFAGLRGGAERGNGWHLDGMLKNKPHTFDDCIACLEYLAQEKYADRHRLGVMGGSNGGLLTAAVTVQRPDLVAAAVSDVPLTDMLRFPRFLMGRYWVSEYGDPEKAEDFAWLYAYSPYHRIRTDVSYPPMLVRAGENDLRVHPSHARKFAARMQNQTAPGSGPAWYYSELDSGHGGGMATDMVIRHNLDAWIFFAKTLGLGKKPRPVH